MRLLFAFSVKHTVYGAGCCQNLISSLFHEFFVIHSPDLDAQTESRLSSQQCYEINAFGRINS